MKQNGPHMELDDALACIRSGYTDIPPAMAGFKESLGRMPPHVDRKQATKNALLLGYGELLLCNAGSEIDGLHDELNDARGRECTCYEGQS